MSSRPTSTPNRPESSGSRAAWNDDGLDAPGRPASSGSENSGKLTKGPKSAKPVKSSAKKQKKQKRENVCQKVIDCKFGGWCSKIITFTYFVKAAGFSTANDCKTTRLHKYMQYIDVGYIFGSCVLANTFKIFRHVLT